ncbi:hypothetical protein RBH29_15990 [Herbivorax sp. ANBcel31]|uniref:hypothetical protein n=1 Tax=Herbivorax sp. ANBcel31 TaxID=3069754 RepID=UPI0027B6C539|nr:hypothetical protein [Herbivorax sp. ANBcel31]MDQ2087931.1 hypothetical protein [Herbivorax sp. ANBcel31]
MSQRKNVLSNIISTAPEFQYSINLEYDFNSDQKIKNYILTSSAMEIMEEVLLNYNTTSDSTTRARILIGPYGKGKSHLVLLIASMLYRKDAGLFSNILNTMKQHKKELYDLAKSIINKPEKLLPVIISGNSLSIKQNLMVGLKQSLIREKLEEIVPDTYFDSAIKMIKLWQKKYKDTYKKLVNELNIPINEFITKLSQYDKSTYDIFTSIYPKLTSGSEFNPIQIEDVLGQYKSVIEKIKSVGYNGIFIIYDEFSKFLEASVDVNSSMEIKLLQDIAEYCNRSGGNQLHIMLTSHKDIDNYVDKLPKEKIDAWKAVNERFRHVSINNLESQTYEIMSKAIIKDEVHWNRFKQENKLRFEELAKDASRSGLFDEIGKDLESKVIYGCYPLQPVATYILPKISEKIAQNERTLFTFLSTHNKNTLGYFVKNVEGDLPFITVAYIFDYFEELFKKENYSSNIYKVWKEAVKALKNVQKLGGKLIDQDTSNKVIKILAVIYMLDGFDKIPPTINTIKHSLFPCVVDFKNIDEIVQDLVDNKILHYMKSKRHLKFTEATDVNIEDLILNTIEKRKPLYNVKSAIREYSKNYYVYPVGYNDENEIVRYFNFDFISGEELLEVNDWEKKISSIKGDGVIYAVLIDDIDIIKDIRKKINKVKNKRVVFILPHKPLKLSDDLRKYDAIYYLIGENEHSNFDSVLNEELNVYLEDIKNIIDNKLKTFTAPEYRLADYYNSGEKVNIFRKSTLSRLLSDICYDLYPHMPLIVNDMINKNKITKQIKNARRKVLQNILKTKTEYKLGLLGNGPDYSIMRATLLVPGIYKEKTEDDTAYLTTEGLNERFSNVINIIRKFIIESNENKKSFGELYDKLTKPEYGIGLKLELIPIYIAVVLREYKEHTVITYSNVEMEITGQLLENINHKPYDYEIYCETWNEKKEKYINEMEKIFLDYLDESEKEYNTFEYIVKAVHRWFLQLPKYAKEYKVDYVKIHKKEGVTDSFTPEAIDQKIDRFRNSLRGTKINSRDFLFNKLFSIFNTKDYDKVIDGLKKCIVSLDNVEYDLIEGYLTDNLKEIFEPRGNEGLTLTSAAKDWYDGLKSSTKNNVFADSKDQLLKKVKELGNDNVEFVESLAKIFTGLRIDDWNDNTVEIFMKDVKCAVDNINDFDEQNVIEAGDKETYKIKYSDKNGEEVEMTFVNQDIEGFSENLLNDIETLMFEDYREAVSNSQKIAILLNVLKKYC